MPLNEADKVTIIQSLQAIVASVNNILTRSNDDIAEAIRIKAECQKILTDIRD
jgi:hypothetical protein